MQMYFNITIKIRFHLPCNKLCQSQNPAAQCPRVADPAAIAPFPRRRSDRRCAKSSELGQECIASWA